MTFEECFSKEDEENIKFQPADNETVSISDFME